MRFKIRKNVFLSIAVIAFIALVGFNIDTGHAGGPSYPDNLAQGREMLEQGQYYQALNLLGQAEKQASNVGQKALASGALGLAHYQLGHEKDAGTLLRKALSCPNTPHHEQARWYAMLAKISVDEGKQEEAQSLFTKALSLAENDPELRSGIELQQVELLPILSRLTKLTAIHGILAQLKPSQARSNYLVRLAEQVHSIGKPGKELSFKALTDAKFGANAGLQAEISSELAQLYEDDRRFQEALELNQMAQTKLLNQDASELALELHWRQGRLHNQLNQKPQALVDYQRAIDVVETIRHDIPLTYQNGESSFRITLEPLYQQMANLLLGQAKQQRDAGKVALLRRAREVSELVKQAELEDFLGGRCAVHPVRKALLETIEVKTAVIYPIVMPDRLELLVSMGDQIHQFTSAVNADTLRSAVHHYAGALRSAFPDEKAYAKTLYQWLVEPLETLLQARQVQTLVIVPDGILRLVPFAALYDGKQYLVERYAVSTSPGLSIIEPSGIKPQEAKALLVGLSEPGDVIHHLPNTLTQGFQGAGERGSGRYSLPKTRGLTLTLDSEQGNTSGAETLRQPLKTDDKVNQQLKAAFSLPGVVKEIEKIAPALSATILLNQDFTVNRFRQELLQQPYALVHIASHLIAGTNSASSFLLAHDDIINFDQIENLFKTGKFANQPIEMLTLSACQTAEGDDRAPLGLSGLALKVKVRSTLGSLWPINDEAAPRLMAEFYKVLNQPGTSKAQALRQAQRSLLMTKGFEHPFFWAPFILIGNWL